MANVEPLLLQNSTYLAAAVLNGDRDNKNVETKTQIAQIIEGTVISV